MWLTIKQSKIEVTAPPMKLSAVTITLSIGRKMTNYVFPKDSSSSGKKNSGVLTKRRLSVFSPRAMVSSNLLACSWMVLWTFLCCYAAKRLQPFHHVEVRDKQTMSWPKREAEICRTVLTYGVWVRSDSSECTHTHTHCVCAGLIYTHIFMFWYRFKQ